MNRIIDLESNFRWRYSPNFSGNFLEFYTYGKSFEEFVDEKAEYEILKDKIKSHILAAKETKLEYGNLAEIIPGTIYERYLEIYNKTLFKISQFEKPKYYDLILNYKKLLLNIESHPVLYENSPKVIKYKLFGTKTGRVALERDSFPILGLSKKNRINLKPHNGHFLELDFNSAEARIFLTLSGIEQPDYDIHLYHMQQTGILDREQCKKDFFSWLYSQAHHDVFDKMYSKEVVLSQFYNGKIKSPLGYEIKCDRFHALSYLIQSYIGFVLMEQAVKVFEFLQNMDGWISFLIYDSLVIDLKDLSLIPRLVSIFEETSFGKYLTNVKVWPASS